MALVAPGDGAVLVLIRWPPERRVDDTNEARTVRKGLRWTAGGARPGHLSRVVLDVWRGSGGPMSKRR